jgi:hypothetical protein
MKDLFGEELHTADDIEGEEYCGTLARETAAAILFDDGVTKAWLPKSKISFYSDTFTDSDGMSCPVIIVTIPDWLAKEKGLLE